MLKTLFIITKQKKIKKYIIRRATSKEQNIGQMILNTNTKNPLSKEIKQIMNRRILNRNNKKYIDMMLININTGTSEADQ